MHKVSHLLPEASSAILKLYSISFINYFAAGTAVANEVVFVVNELGSSPTSAGLFVSAAAVLAIFSTLVFGRILPEGTSSRGWSSILLAQGTLAVSLIFITGNVQVLVWVSFMALIPVSQSAAISVVSAMQISDIVVVRSRIRVIINIAMALGASSWSVFRLFGISPSWIYFIVGCALIVAGLACLALLNVVQEKHPSEGNIVDTSKSTLYHRLGHRFWFYIFCFFPFFLGSGLLSFGVPFIILRSSWIDHRSIGIFFAINMALVVLFQVKFSHVVDRSRALPVISVFSGILLLVACLMFSAFSFTKAGLGLIAIIVVIVSFVEIASSNIDFKIFYHLTPRHLFGSASTARTSSESGAQVLAPLLIPSLVVVHPLWFVFLLVCFGAFWCFSLWRLSACVSR